MWATEGEQSEVAWFVVVNAYLPHKAHKAIQQKSLLAKTIAALGGGLGGQGSKNVIGGLVMFCSAACERGIKIFAGFVCMSDE